MTKRADMDAVLDDLTDDEFYESHDWEEEDDIVYTDESAVCPFCERVLPLSYRRGDYEDRLLSIRLSAQAHICSERTPDVTIVTADGTRYSLDEYLNR